MASTCQPFPEGTQYEQHWQALQHGGCVLPSSVYGDMALRQVNSVAPERSSSSAGRSTTEARALKIHSDAERRRRERINAHLATLRRMIPDTKQMDKATLLASTIDQLKGLKRRTSEATLQPIPIPSESNCITVDCHTGADEQSIYIQVSISCDDRPGLLADIAAAVRGLRLRAVRADMASLGGRTRCSFLLCKESCDVSLLMMSEGGVKALEEDARQALAGAAFSEMAAHGCSGSRSRSKRLRVFCTRRL
ncbi:hypothetical protein PR202_ga11379 [Eleusine coracana subsp. coracana]|uniref:BHLH domain-containing protein n=1 Tax=Eleusine coracana subsp. coracana TaxID=191504 RepID=A0AAV5C9A9_ELECO|nr:hypothetical protein PR202_ga11379 [Eleusine coracana subsp. coracana]